MAESEMVERVARAIAMVSSDDGWRHPPYNNLHTDASNNHWRHKARAAIEAMREPTEGMEGAGVAMDDLFAEADAGKSVQMIYGAMISAALGQEGTEG